MPLGNKPSPEAMLLSQIYVAIMHMASLGLNELINWVHISHIVITSARLFVPAKAYQVKVIYK